jgi:hypothetical protein
MKKHFIIFFVMVIGGLILCAYLNQSNYYNCIEGFDFKKTYKADDNTIAIISQNRNSSYTITVTNSDNTTTTYTTSVGDSTNKFYNPDGSYAVVSADEKHITITGANKSTKIYYNRSTSTTTTTTDSSDDYDNYNHYYGTYNASVYYSSNGNGYTARILDTGTNKMIIVTKADGTTETYYVNSDYPDVYNGPKGSFIKLITASDGTKTLSLTNSDGEKVYYVKRYVYTKNYSDTDNFESTTSYNSSLPEGIKGSEIPIGYEDMYILKSQIVPPVCPACPDYYLSCNSNKCNSKTSGSSGSGSSGSSGSGSGSSGSSGSGSGSSGSSGSGSGSSGSGSGSSGSGSGSSGSTSNSGSGSNSNTGSNPATSLSNKDFSSTTYNPNDLNEIGNGNVSGTNYKIPSTTIPIPVLSDFSMFGM